ncbi:hypothetical protein [Candidatus Nitrospira neomarina]|uniref:Uncharacterized protein n=1 Tax=Candidatus Nitrospira neomarina TaxID=3020899 RepID=A0AA96GJS0_9BACT|nr:hypothetical protein [Candidatus Nitrospira neomarina]WNM62267.1 hypothetical protein PQG83_00550 [Candidatus Nitrospira neomarina]
MNAALIMFGIEAGVKLGTKLNDVLVDATVEKPMLLPVGELFGSVRENDAIEFFDEHTELTERGQPYHGLSRADKLKAYLTLKQIDDRAVGSGSVSKEAIEIVSNLQKLQQYKQGLGSKPALQRVVGTLVEIGIDYFVTHPEAIGAKSNERKILQAFIKSLDEVNFAEGTHTEIVADVVVFALDTLKVNTSLIMDDARLQALVGGVTNSLLMDIQAAGSRGAITRRENFVRRIGSSILKGGALAFSQNIDLFLPKENSEAKQLVSSTLTQLLDGTHGKEDLFTNESLELLFHSALRAVAENPKVFSDDAVLQELISRTVTAMTDTTGRKVFSSETVTAVLNQALLVGAENIETLIDPANPQKQLLANATRAVAQSLSGSLAGGGTVKDLLSHQQLVSLMGVVFKEIAKNPEQLLGNASLGDRKAALAQIIGSVARALGDEPRRFVNGKGFVLLVETVMQTAAKNADKLLNLDTTSTRDNVLFAVIQQTVDAILDKGDPRELLNREVFLHLAGQILPVVSANLAGLEEAPEAVRDAVGTALGLAQGDLKGRINGENLPTLVVGLLTEVLWNELDLTEATAVLQSATRALKAA